MWLPLSQLHRGSRWQWVNDIQWKVFQKTLGTLETEQLACLDAFTFSILGWLSDLSVRFCKLPWRCKRPDLHQRQEREARSISGALAHYDMMALDFPFVKSQVVELWRLAYVLSSDENYWLYRTCFLLHVDGHNQLFWVEELELFWHHSLGTGWRGKRLRLRHSCWSNHVTYHVQGIKKRFQLLSRVSHLETKPERNSTFGRKPRPRGKQERNRHLQKAWLHPGKLGESLNDIPPQVSSTIQCSSWVTLIPWGLNVPMWRWKELLHESLGETRQGQVFWSISLEP